MDNSQALTHLGTPSLLQQGRGQREGNASSRNVGGCNMEACSGDHAHAQARVQAADRLLHQLNQRQASLTLEPGEPGWDPAQLIARPQGEAGQASEGGNYQGNVVEVDIQPQLLR